MLLLGQENLKGGNRMTAAESIVEAIKGRRTISQSKELPCIENLILVFEPNAARYEFHDVDNRILASFLHKKYNVMLFNYIGYDSEESRQFSLLVE